MQKQLICYIKWTLSDRLSDKKKIFFISLIKDQQSKVFFFFLFFPPLFFVLQQTMNFKGNISSKRYVDNYFFIAINIYIVERSKKKKKMKKKKKEKEGKERLKRR